MGETEWTAFVGVSRSGAGSIGRLRLYCSKGCASAAGYGDSQAVTRTAAKTSGGVEFSETCARCGKPFEKKAG